MKLRGNVCGDNNFVADINLFVGGSIIKTVNEWPQNGRISFRCDDKADTLNWR